MTAQEKKKQARGPESGFFDTLKGQDVLIDLHGGNSADGYLGAGAPVRLLWVDRYTIGIRTRDGRERMIYKKFIRGIERDGNNAIESDRPAAL